MTSITQPPQPQPRSLGGSTSSKSAGGGSGSGRAQYAKPHHPSFSGSLPGFPVVVPSTSTSGNANSAEPETFLPLPDHFPEPLAEEEDDDSSDPKDTSFTSCKSNISDEELDTTLKDTSTSSRSSAVLETGATLVFCPAPAPVKAPRQRPAPPKRTSSQKDKERCSVVGKDSGNDSAKDSGKDSGKIIAKDSGKDSGKNSEVVCRDKDSGVKSSDARKSRDSTDGRPAVAAKPVRAVDPPAKPVRSAEAIAAAEAEKEGVRRITGKYADPGALMRRASVVSNCSYSLTAPPKETLPSSPTPVLTLSAKTPAPSCFTYNPFPPVNGAVLASSSSSPSVENGNVATTAADTTSNNNTKTASNNNNNRNRSSGIVYSNSIGPSHHDNRTSRNSLLGQSNNDNRLSSNSIGGGNTNTRSSSRSIGGYSSSRFSNTSLNNNNTNNTNDTHNNANNNSSSSNHGNSPQHRLSTLLSDRKTQSVRGGSYSPRDEDAAGGQGTVTFRRNHSINVKELISLHNSIKAKGPRTSSSGSNITSHNAVESFTGGRRLSKSNSAGINGHDAAAASEAGDNNRLSISRNSGERVSITRHSGNRLSSNRTSKSEVNGYTSDRLSGGSSDAVFRPRLGSSASCKGGPLEDVIMRNEGDKKRRGGGGGSVRGLAPFSQSAFSDASSDISDFAPSISPSLRSSASFNHGGAGGERGGGGGTLGRTFTSVSGISIASLGEGVSAQDIHQVEVFYKSHGSEVIVCHCLANFYLGATQRQKPSVTQSAPVTPMVVPKNPKDKKAKKKEESDKKKDKKGKGKDQANMPGELTSSTTTLQASHESLQAAGSGSDSWQFVTTGIPLLVNDTGVHVRERQLSLVIAEKGTGFVLWRDTLGPLTKYSCPHSKFHTLHLSTDPDKLGGLSFDDHQAAAEFASTVKKFTFELEAEAGLGKKEKKLRRKQRMESLRRKLKYKPPKKTEISQPCCFEHVTKLERPQISGVEGMPLPPNISFFPPAPSGSVSDLCDSVHDTLSLPPTRSDYGASAASSELSDGGSTVTSVGRSSTVTSTGR